LEKQRWLRAVRDALFLVKSGGNHAAREPM
jgi:hypothetical protein